MTGDPGSFRSTLTALGLVCALVAGFALLPRVLRSQAGASVGRDAPDIALPLVANTAATLSDPATFRLSELRGHAVLLDFWATWCEPCRLEAPIVEQLSRRWSDRGVVVVGVDTDTPDQGDPARFAAAHGLTYPMVKDDGRASRAYGVDALPTLVVVSRMGKIVAVRSGMTDDAELERLVREAL
ncbi:MAG TPA: TlpA disulfide reductase family protein [Polyangiaceae bacterium]|jgi:thiol-disulfide isomerase/thioredoxin